MRSRLCAVVIAMAAGVASAQPAEDAVARANRGAYDWTLKCFVLDSKASNDRERAGDLSKAADYNAKARKAFDMAYSAGARIGLSEAQVAHDLDYAQLHELPILVQDEGYFRRTAGTCKALGLL